jgi:TrmH RNA methyltransferase
VNNIIIFGENENGETENTEAAGVLGGSVFELADSLETPVKHDSASLSSAAYRVAEGGMEHLHFYTVTNITGFLKQAKKQLVTIGTTMRSRTRLSDLDAKIKGNSGRQGTIVILGNEESGIPENILTLCHLQLRIPGTGRIESLNVATAAGIIMYTLSTI